MTTIRPPTSRTSSPAGIARSRTFNSLFTSMRMAWKVRFAGLPPIRRAGAGMLAFTNSARSVVVRNLFSLLALTIFAAMELANLSSP